MKLKIATTITNGIITCKNCYDKNGKISLKMYRNRNTYTREEFGKTRKVAVLNTYLDIISFKEFLEEKLVKEGYISNKKLKELYFDYAGNLVFTADYTSDIPEFIGDTIRENTTLINGLSWLNDTLYAIHNSNVVHYKTFHKNRRLASYWSPDKELHFKNNGMLWKSKVSSYEKEVFTYPVSKRSDYIEIDTIRNLELKVYTSGENISQIEINSKESKIELFYFLDQLQKAVKIEYFEDGYYKTVITNNHPAKKYKIIRKNSQQVSEVEIDDFVFSVDDREEDGSFFKTGNIITLAEYNLIRLKVFN